MRLAVLFTGRVTFAVAVVVSLFAPRTADADSLTLMWDSNSEPVAGYVVYSGIQPGSLSQRYDVGPATSFTMPNAVAGQRYCFAVSAYFTPTTEGPRSPEVCGFSNQFPTLVNPGSRTSTVGQSTTLQLVGSDPDGLPVTYLASGLPPGLSLMTGTGFISGAPTAAGTYQVTASASDGVLTSASQSFTWSVSAAPTADTTPPVVAITSPTTASTHQSSSVAISLAGTAADAVGVSSVTWASDRGGSGTATGTTSWSVTSIGLQAGTNIITVTASDAAGNQGTDVLTVTLSSESSLPTVSIATPTSSSTYGSSAAAIAVGGTATGVSSVSWMSDRGGSGTASGTTNWSVASIALQSGANVITVTARDSAGNRATDVLTVNYTASDTNDTAPDTNAPSITIAGPTTASSYSTTLNVVTLGGTSADDQGVTAVTWSSDRGGSGFSSGTTSWSVPSVPLLEGTNIITMQAQDAAGNRGTDTLTVTYTAPESEPSTITLSAGVYLSGRRMKVFLKWTIVPGRDVAVYRDGTQIAKTSNDGSWSDSPRGAGPYSYRLCLAGTSTCSNTVVVSR